MNFPKSKIKIALALPWYAGADRDCVANFLAFQHYLGRLQERLSWIARRGASDSDIAEMGKLDPANTTGFSEIPKDLYGVEFEFGISDEIGCSLPGLARERCVENALKWGADFILFYDSDMMFGTDLFLRLFMSQKPVVAALAFTSRTPIQPVIYRFKEYSKSPDRITADIEVVPDYKRDTLQQVDAVGSGVFMVDAKVFEAIPKPWFNSPGIGEDIFFCLLCKHAGIDVWVNTAAKTLHKPTFPQSWHDETTYFQANPHLHSVDREQLAKAVNDVCTHVLQSGATITEGSSTLPQLEFLAKQARSGAKRICEVGFNSGMSAVALLAAVPGAEVVSYDLGEWSCVQPAKDYIDKHYPGRHTLVLGDSKKTLWKGSIGEFDLSFVDGGHDYKTAWADICAVGPQSKRVIVDDLQMPGVEQAYHEAVDMGILRPISIHTDDEVLLGTPRKWALALGGRG